MCWSLEIEPLNSDDKEVPFRWNRTSRTSRKGWAKGNVHKESSCLKREVGRDNCSPLEEVLYHLKIQFSGEGGEIFGMIRAKYDCSARLIYSLSTETQGQDTKKTTDNPLLRTSAIYSFRRAGKIPMGTLMPMGNPKNTRANVLFSFRASVLEQIGFSIARVFELNVLSSTRGQKCRQS